MRKKAYLGKGRYFTRSQARKLRNATVWRLEVYRRVVYIGGGMHPGRSIMGASVLVEDGTEHIDDFELINLSV